MGKKEQADDDKHRLVSVESAQYHNFEVLYSAVLFVAEAREVGIRGDESAIRCFSCVWNFCRIAHETLDKYPVDVVMEGEVDPTANLRQALEAQMHLYQVTDIEALSRFFPMCRTLAFRRTLPWNSRFQAWLDSGGHSYNLVSREPDARGN